MGLREKSLIFLASIISKIYELKLDSLIATLNQVFLSKLNLGISSLIQWLYAEIEKNLNLFSKGQSSKVSKDDLEWVSQTLSIYMFASIQFAKISFPQVSDLIEHLLQWWKKGFSLLQENDDPYIYCSLLGFLVSLSENLTLFKTQSDSSLVSIISFGIKILAPLNLVRKETFFQTIQDYVDTKEKISFFILFSIHKWNCLKNCLQILSQVILFKI